MLLLLGFHSVDPFNPIPHGGGGARGILPTKFLGRHNSCSESSSSTKFGQFSYNLMGNLVIITKFQNMLLVSRDVTQVNTHIKETAFKKC